MIYEYIDNVNFISLATAESTDDQNDILCRLYNNNVQIDYTVDEKEKKVHILFVEAMEQRQGNGTVALKSFLKDFINYNIEIEALYYLEKWYKKFGFDFQYYIDDMLCCKMILKRGAS